jgi:sugar lactone lactonase YvrE
MSLVKSMLQPQCIWELGAELGEGPVWLADEEAICLVDIKQRKIHRCAADGSAQRTWDAPEQIGFALPIEGGGLLCGLPGRLAQFSPETGDFVTRHWLEPGLPGNRLNDGYVDPEGCLWFGSMDNGETAATGALYRLERDGNILQKDHGYVITNGPCLSPDGRSFYHTDTLDRVLYAFDHAPGGILSNRRVLIEFTGAGHPDGTTVDAEGCLWVALFGGARIERYSPTGALLETVEFPCPNITKVAFGGPDLRTAFVSTARKGMSSAKRLVQPLAGGLFSFRVDVPGQVQHRIITGRTA